MGGQGDSVSHQKDSNVQLKGKGSFQPHHQKSCLPIQGQAMAPHTKGEVFVPRSWGHNRLIHSPEEEGTAFDFSLGFEPLPICKAQHNI